MTTNPKMHEPVEDLNFTVSPVIGDGAEAHRIARVGDWTLTIPGVDGTVPEIPDTELAARLDMKLHHLRELSSRHEKARHIAPRVYRTVRETGGRPGNQRFYSEYDALFLVTCSETPKAVALKREMIRVYMAVRHGLAPRPANDTALRSEVAELKTAIASQSAQMKEILSAMATGIVGSDAGDKIRAGLRRIGYAHSDRKGEANRRRRSAENVLRNLLGFAGKGTSWDMLPRNALAFAERWLSMELDATLATRNAVAQQALHFKSANAPSN